jgi:hypothetical protein
MNVQLSALAYRELNALFENIQSDFRFVRMDEQ